MSDNYNLTIDPMPGRLKILLVASGFYPEISPRSHRATELAKEFIRLGHDVTVITKYREFDYSSFLSGFPFQLLMWRKPCLPKIPESSQPPFSYISRFFRRTLLLLFEYPGIEEMFLVKKALKDKNEFDLMISFAVPYPVHWGVAFARTTNHSIAKKWIADCGDPYMGDVLDSFRKPFYFAYLEKWFCRKADFVTIPVQAAITAYYPEFHHKIKIIPQGFRFDISTTTQNVSISEIPEFAYAGSFLKGIRDPTPLLEFLSRTELPFRFHVFTNNSEFLVKYLEPLKDKLIVSGYIPRDELLKKLAGMDFLINFDNNTSLNIPSKLIDYAFIGRPVINIRKEFSNKHINEFLRADYKGRMVLPDAQQYHISNVTLQFIELLNLDSR